MDKKTALLYIQTNQFKFLLRKTEQFITWALKQVNNPYVACSFGKDSAVMLDLVIKQRADVEIVFVRRIETDLIDNYKNVISRWKEDKNLKLTEISYRGWLESNPDGKGIANATKNLSGFDSFFVGLRAQESTGRRITLKKNGKFYRMKSGKTRICPLAWWTTNDIAAYNLAYELPILNKYMIEGFESRTTAAIPSKFPHESIQSLKTRDVNAYNQLLTLLPDVRFYT